MKVLITPDVMDWAIGSLTKSIVKHNKRFNWQTIAVHPRGLLEAFPALHDSLKEGIDVWMCMYWNSGKQIMEQLPEFKDVQSILVHQNHHCIDKDKWREYNGVVEATRWGLERLNAMHEHAYQVPYGIDLDRFDFIDDYPPKNEKPTIGYIGRVVQWKNLDKICLAAEHLDYRVIGSGYVDDKKYFDAFIKRHADEGRLFYRGGIGRQGMTPSNVKDDMYYRMDVFVMYSTGEKESGTLPLLEAMARGVPVMATSQGMARDIIEDGKNGIIFTEENFEKKLKELMEDEELRKTIRKNALRTAHHYSEQRMARNYAKVIYDVAFAGQTVVSVVIPTHNRAKQLAESIAWIEADPYMAKEIIVVDDGSDDETRELVKKLKQSCSTPILYLNTDQKTGYNLGMARNMGVVESLGKVLLFLDDRLRLDGVSLEHIAQVPEGEWHFGKKQTKSGVSTKRQFIENFSWIRKKDFVDGGMFNERMNAYGGMSQITREQYAGKVEFVYDDKACCVEMCKSGSKNSRSIWKAKDIINKLND